MFNNNQTIMELYVNKDPQRSDRADVVKASCTMFQGRRSDDRKPMFVTVEAWKFPGKCLETARKGQTIVCAGNLRMDYWGQDNEKFALVLNADSVAAKIWPDDAATAPAPQRTQQNIPQQSRPDDDDIPF